MIATATALSFGLAACGGGDDSTSVAALPDQDHFCELVDQLNQASAEAYGAMEAGGAPTPDELAETQRQVITENADLIDEARQVAPDEIRNDFVLSTDSARQHATEDDRSTPSDEVAAANQRIQKFATANCELSSTPQPPSG